MSSDTQFTALGPTQIGFQCHGTNIAVGGLLVGNEFGVQARCGGALGDSSTAVHGQTGARNATGVIGAAHTGPNAFVSGAHPPRVSPGSSTERCRSTAA